VAQIARERSKCFGGCHSTALRDGEQPDHVDRLSAKLVVRGEVQPSSSSVKPSIFPAGSREQERGAPANRLRRRAEDASQLRHPWRPGIVLHEALDRRRPDMVV